jgi:predicted lipid-binding transport protein (Tim44 family)
MFASKGFRLTALFATLLMAFSMVAIDTAEARRGGSFGSRGARTTFSVPATPTSPTATTGVQRSMTDSTTTRNATTAGTASAARPSLFGGFGGALLGGLLFSGLFGMFFGYGFGGFGGMLALLFQLVIIGLIVSWFMRRRQQPAAAGNANAYRYEAPNAQSHGAGSGTRHAQSRSAASARAGKRDEVGISDVDLGIFQQRLSQLQDAYSREDYAALRKISTPEVMGYLAEELGENVSRGLRNEVFDVNLLEGDVAEAWREESAEYASVALRYESRDVTRNRATGEIVDGDDRVTQTTEIWTFVRRNGGDWLIAAIQDA